MNAWDRLSATYDTLWVQKYSLIPTRAKVLQLINGQKPGFSLLDVGCATGQLLYMIKEKYPNARLFGIDKSQNMIDIAKSKGGEISFEALGVEEFVVQDKFDVLTCCHSLPYYPEKEEALEKLSQLIKDDGRAIFVHASINNIYDRAVMYFVERNAEKADYLSKKRFCAMAQKYFEIKSIFKIKEKWFMPSIYGFVLGKKAEQ